MGSGRSLTNGIIQESIFFLSFLSLSGVKGGYWLSRALARYFAASSTTTFSSKAFLGVISISPCSCDLMEWMGPSSLPGDRELESPTALDEGEEVMLAKRV